jgi:hypothetical protein
VVEGVIESEMRVVSQPHHVITGISKGDLEGRAAIDGGGGAAIYGGRGFGAAI